MFEVDTPHPLLEKDSLTEAERAELLEGYVTRGRALKLEDDRGIPDSHRRRELNLGQFFTPSRVVKVLGQALGLVHHSAWDKTEVGWAEQRDGSLVDVAGCGNGRMFGLAPKGWSLHGADIDPLACRAARLIYPEAEILEASLLAFRGKGEKRFAVAAINPPFSMNLTSRKALSLECAQWGVMGKNTSVESHVAAIELSMEMANVVGAVLPTSAFGSHESPLLTAPKGNSDRGLRFRLDLPKDAFKAEGTEWPCSLAIFGTFKAPSFYRHAIDWDVVEEALGEWIVSNGETSAHWGSLRDHLRHWGHEKPSLAAWRVQEASPKARRIEPTGSIGEGPCVRLALGGRAHRVMMHPNGLVAALAIEEARLWSGWKNSKSFEPQSGLDWACDLVRNAGCAEESIGNIYHRLSSLPGIDVRVDPQLLIHAKRADVRAAVEMTDFNQWVRKGDAWVEKGHEEPTEDHPGYGLIHERRRLFRPRAESIPTGLTTKGWDRKAKAHVERSWPAFPLYAFSQKDICRALGKRSVIYSAKQGLAKTRFSLGAFLASGQERALWILESRLVNEFKRELRKIGMLDHFHQIDSKEDLRHLKAINVITYSRLWRPVNEGSEKRGKNWGPGKSFAAALAKRRMLVIVDEGHKIKAQSKQGIAARQICGRAKRVVDMTGTAIQSYPRNILGLVAAGWGDGSSMNPYGYRRPIEGGYSVEYGRTRRHRDALIRGVTKFVDEFVDVIWYTPAFEQTADSGMKSREIPRLKNVPLWESFIRSKLIRRVPAEPEVRASGLKTPEAKPEFVEVKPSERHFAHYKLVLDHFASVWKARLERERSSGRSENNAAYILPELDALRFASTVPVAKHRWADTDPLLKYTGGEPTALMLEALKRIAAWVEGGDRVVVGAEKPDALRWLADLLADLSRWVPDSEPIPCVLALDSDIKKRNAAIDRARDDDEAPVLLLSVGMGCEGLNLPEFSKLLTLDLGWVPGKLDQYRYRILRPDQVGEVEICHLFHSGMIDDYMRQLCEAKLDAIAEAIDGQETVFDYENWKDYRTFALEMLELEGYKFATEALRRERQTTAA